MSTRRTTRAGSRAASNSGASPAPTNLTDIPATPSGRTRRSANAGLPAVGLKRSTAYGSAGISQPARVSNPQGSSHMKTVLDNLLEPDDPNAKKTPAPGNTSATPTGQTQNQGVGQDGVTPSPHAHSYLNESLTFGNAEIESSLASIANDLSNIPEEPENNGVDSGDDEVFPRNASSPDSLAQRRLEELARENTLRNAGQAPTNVVPPYHAAQASGFNRAIPLVDFGALTQRVSAFTQRISNNPWNAWWLIPLGVVLFAIFLMALLASPGTFQWYGLTDLRNFGQFIPSGVANPLLPDDALSIRKRLSSIESDIIIIKRDLKGVDFKAIHRLQELLPDFLVVKKKNGMRQIPDDFWHALQHKIRSDETLVNEPASSSTDGEVSEKKVRKIVGNEWAKYLSENEAKLSKFSDEDFVRRFPKLLEENDVVTRSDIIDMISQNWDDNSPRIISEMGHLSKQLERTARDVMRLQQQGPHKMTRDEIKAISHDVLKYLPDAQLKAAANANLQSSVNWGLTKVNHFSRAAGAVVNREVTSPTFVFPSQDVWFGKRIMRNLMRDPIAIPLPPTTALTKWEEYGDCWCSAAVDSTTGYGPSLGVFIGSSIYPEQVVIEHISSDATLQPGAAPREMELLAFIPDPETFKAVTSLSKDLFKDERGEETGKLLNYVRVATWTYDAEANQNVQPFAVQLDMKSLEAHTNRLVVRSKNNWGGESVPYTCLYRVRVHGEVVIPPPNFE